MDLNELIKKFNNGDKEALAEIYDVSARCIFSYAYMITKNSFDAEIALKNTMIEISKEAYKYNEKKEPLVWILSITEKYASDIVEKISELANINTPEYLKFIDNNANVMSDNLAKSLDKLSLEERRVLTLKGYVKLKDKDIAKITGFSKKFIKEHYKDTYNIEDIDKLSIPEKNDILIECDEPDVEKYKSIIKKRAIIKFTTVAAVLIIGVVGLCTLPDIISKNIHYYKAVKYFNENNLVTKNFTKDEVMKVYDDLLLDDFSADITKEIIDESIINEGVIGKLHIVPSNANTEDIFNILSSDDEFVEEKTSYKLEESSNSVYLEKYEYGKLQWKTSIVEFDLGIWGYSMYKEWGDYIVVCMQTEVEDSLKEVYVALVDMEGNKLWCNRIECEFNLIFESVQLNEDTISLFTSYKTEIRYTELDVHGNVIINNEHFHPYINIVYLEKNENGYKIQYEKAGRNYIIEIDENGKDLSHKEISRKVIEDFNWKDSIMFNGKVYYSGYSMSEMEDVDLEFKSFQPITDEEDIEVLTNAYRKRFCAKLLVYNEETDTFEEIYKIYGARGRELSVDINGNLNWSVEGIKEYTWKAGSGVSFSGESLIYKYVFDNDEKVIKKIETYHKRWF